MTSHWMPFGLKPNAKKSDDSGPYYADIQARGLAACIDIVLLFSLFQRPFNALTQQLYRHVDGTLLAQARAANESWTILQLLWQSRLPQWWLLNSAIQIMILGIVIVTLQCWLYTTPGKWLLGLRIVRADTLNKPARWQFVIRFFAYIVACLPLMLGIFWISFNKQHRGLHDRIAGTAVIHTHPRGWVWQQVKRAVRGLRDILLQKTH